METPSAMDAPFHYAEFDPAPDLARHVARYWVFRVRGAGAAHRLWPDACISLALVPQPPMVSIVGPHLGPLDVAAGDGAVYWGARFWPDAGGLVLGIPATAVRDVNVRASPAVTLAFAPFFERLRAGAMDEASAAQLFDRILRPLVVAARPIDDAVRRAVLAIMAGRGEQPITAVALSIGLGERQLQRRFRIAVGLTPKQFARIRRLRTAVGGLLGPDPARWAEVAANLGYADQSHLIHEFSQLTGLTPVAFEERLRHIQHGRVDP